METLQLLHHEFFRNALWNTILVGIPCGLVGTYIVARRMVFLSGGITHASFGGLGLAYLLGLPPLPGAALFALAAAFAIQHLAATRRVPEDTLIGILWSAGMALGIIAIHLTPGYAPNLLSYLFGNILTVTTDQTWTSLALCATVLLYFTLFARPLFHVAFDRDHARAQRLPVTALETGITTLVALTIVLSMKLAGIILVISYLTIPTAIAARFCTDFKRQLLLAPAISCTGSVAGLLLSAALDLPSGATIVLCFLLLLAIAHLARR
jgi:zinc transport system permease protein